MAESATQKYRFPRLEALSKTASEYVDKELAKIDKDVAALEAILQGRKGSKSIQTPTVAKVASVAFSDLSSYLKGE